MGRVHVQVGARANASVRFRTKGSR
jgi:hypothetical protein